VNTTSGALVKPAWSAPVAWRRAAVLRRAVVIGLILTQTLVATYYMLAILPYHGGTGLEDAIAGVFVLLFAWISAGFWITVTGFAVRRSGGDRYSLMNRHPAGQLAATPLARTAVVMPLCHEPVERVTAGLRAVYRCLEKTGMAEHFDLFMLSDSRDPEVWLQEQAQWYRLCQELDAFGRIYYRRRRVKRHYKSGNIADFLRRWGRDYEYMVILDADSLVGGDTLVRMVQLMQHEPQVGIIQTRPVIVNGETAFARLQQFASHTLGRLIGEGLAALQLGDAAYWGHNAIIRVDAFMRFCGLRKLPALGLFRGPILSHDFVEAAYMGRAGYEVWLEPALGQSFEESPPSLDDELLRDRRWIKGNLQHLWVLATTSGLRFAHRMMFVNGALSYLTAPLWFAFLVLTGTEAVVLTLWPIDYFPQAHALFPLWPQWHPAWALQLAAGTAAVLFLPKALALLDIALSRQMRNYGGTLRLSLSLLTETAASALMAPIRMMAHTRFVLGALFNIRLQWGGQNRAAESRAAAVMRRQGPMIVFGAAWAGFALWLQPVYFAWSLPVALPLILAAPTIVLSGRRRTGDWLSRLGLLVVTEEHAPPPVLQRLRDAPPPPPRRLSHFDEAVIDPQANGIHAALAGRTGRGGAHVMAALLQRCLSEGTAALTDRERARIAQDARCLRALHRRVWCSPGQSYWGARVDGIRRCHDGAKPSPSAGDRA